MAKSDEPQWTFADFEERRPVYRVRTAEVVLLGAAVFPFAVSLCYWVECQFLKPFLTGPGAADTMMWLSLVGGAAISAASCVIAIEWLKAYHYYNLRKTENALGRCHDLLFAALQDNDVVANWVRKHKGRPSLMKRLRETVSSAEEGARVEMYHDELVFMLIDEFIKKVRRSEGQHVLQTQLQNVPSRGQLS
jgi:hypothetical protein